MQVDYEKAADNVYKALSCLSGITNDLQLASVHLYHSSRIICEALIQLGDDLDNSVGESN